MKINNKLGAEYKTVQGNDVGDSNVAMGYPSYCRWDIVMAEFGQDYNGCVIRGYRPAVVFSLDAYNESSPIMILIPLTKRLKGVDRDYHVFVDKNDCKGYDASGIALVEQMRPMDRRFVNRKIGEVVDVHMHAKIEGAVLEFWGCVRIRGRAYGGTILVGI